MKRHRKNLEGPIEQNETTILTPSEIGALSPRVPRRSEGSGVPLRATDDSFVALKRKFSRWICQRCKEQNCELKYPATSAGRRRLIVDCNKYQCENSLAGKIADCLFIEDAA